MLLTPALLLLPAGGVGFHQLHTRDITGRDVSASLVRSPVRRSSPSGGSQKCFLGDARGGGRCLHMDGN